MNNRNSMGDKTDMGLQKIDMPTFEGSLNVKEKRCATPAIDLLSNFEREMCRNGNSFQQDCEEFLKIMANNAEKTHSPILTNGGGGGNQSSFPEANELNNLERDLLHQVDDDDDTDGIRMVEQNGEDHVPELRLSVASSSSASSTRTAVDASFAETSDEGRKRCAQIERRIDRLTRRLKLQQSKVYGVHTSEQISSLLDYCRCQYAATLPPPVDDGTSRSSHSQPTMDVYLKRLKRCSDQSCVPQSSEKFLHYFGSGTKESHKARNISSSVVPKFRDDLYEHIEKISGQLHAQVKAITNDFDSDVTASSSGNDSLDEESPLTPENMEDRSKKIPLSKRALWRWLRNRASIAYRLSWLQSHMSALEYTIHHYTEIHKKLRNAKGQIVLQNEHSNSASSTTAATSTASVAAKYSGTDGTHVVLNGFHGSLLTVSAVDGEANDSSSLGSAVAATAANIGSTFPNVTVASSAGGAVAAAVTSSAGLEKGTVATSVTADAAVAAESVEETCSRTCPLLRSKFRRRNLVRLDALPVSGTVNSLGRKFASIRCDCVPPLTCVLCARRGPGVDVASQHIYANLLPVQSKIALLEPTYHPVLSFPTDVSVSTHISALLNNEDVLDVCGKTIENRTAAQMSIKRNYSNYKSTEEIRRANSEGLEFKRRRKYVRRQPNNSQTIPFGRSQLSKQRHAKIDKALSFRKRRRKRLRTKRPVGNDNGLEESADEGLYYRKEDVYSSQPGSPHSSHSSTVKDPIRRKRGQSYDIDNFIIPPNSTPAVVASKPQYKEILIPTWKIVEDKSFRIENLDRNLLQPDILEDLSDENVIRLHEMLEQNERKKFRTNATRNRSRKRTDSCPETSEANTPERIASPVPPSAETNDTATSNVSISLSNVAASNHNNASANKAKIPSLNKTRTSMDCDNSSVTEHTSVDVVTPYELREFPLSDEAFKEFLASQHGKIEESDPDDESTNDSKPPPENEGRDESPFTNSVDSDSEDPDDPDWMLNNDDVKPSNC